MNNFIADTVMDDGSRGVDDQFIRSAMARVTWQITPKWKLGAYHDEIDKYRGHDMQSRYDPETAAVQWFSPAYHTNQAKLTGTLTPRLLVEGGFSSNLEYYTNSYQEGIEQPRGTAEWYANTDQTESDLGGWKRAAQVQNTQSPARFNWQGAVVLRHRFAQHQDRLRSTSAAPSITPTTRNGDLYQVYRSSTTGIPYSVPDSVVIRNTPLARYGERLNYDVGIFVQDTWTMRRLTVTGGIRYEWLNAQVEAAETPAGRFVPARKFDVIKDLPNWSDPAPRMSAVYDLFGNSKTALKYSLNRYNQARTTGIAGNYNPLATQTATLTWRDLEQRRHRAGRRHLSARRHARALHARRRRLRAERHDLADLRHASLNTYGDYPRTGTSSRASKSSTSSSRACRSPAAGSTARSTT